MSNFDWGEYVTLAHSLSQKAAPTVSEEACLRAAISRGYYGSFCSARALLVRRREVTLSGTGRDHATVYLEYQRHGSTLRRRVGLWLERLYLDRCKADYDDVVPGLSSRAQAALANADSVVQAIQHL